MIGALVNKIPRVVTVEENVRHGGFGSAVLEKSERCRNFWISYGACRCRDAFVEHGPQKLLREKYGIDAMGIVHAARRVCGISLQGRPDALPEKTA